jgi:hypothetical protein
MKNLLLAAAAVGFGSLTLPVVAQVAQPQAQVVVEAHIQEIQNAWHHHFGG